MRKKTYTKKDLVALFEEFVDGHLDNGIEDSASDMEGIAMASKHRECYTIVNSNGEKELIRLYGKDKADTDMKFQMLCSDRAQNHSKWNPDLTFKVFVEDHYKPNHMVPPFIAETTQGKYEYALRRYIFPELGEKRMIDLTVNDIQQFRKKMSNASEYGYAKNLTAKSIEDMTGFLNKIFKVAVAMKVIEDNPVNRPLLKKVGETPKHHKPLDPVTLDRCKKLIPTLKDERVRIYASILFFNGGGMRPEEILGLKWEHVDLDAGYANVIQAVTYAGMNRHTVIKETKTPNSVRGVILPKILVDILAQVNGKSGYIIHGKDRSKPIPYSGWQRTYRKMQELLGIKGQYCNYDLRTTYATEMIEDGYSSAITAKMMGHKDSRMVDTVYAQTRREGIEKLRGHFEAKNSAYGSV